MDHHVIVVHQNPLGTLTSFHAVWLKAQLGHLVLDLVRQGFYLGGAGRGSDDKIIAQAGQVFDLNQFDILSF